MDPKNTTLDDLSSVIGFSATLRLVAWFGDAGNLYVPVQAAEDQVIAKLIGVSGAKRLSAEWPGEHINVPRLSDYEVDMRRGAIAKMLESGMSTREVSHVLHISERRVQQICRELEVAGLIAPVGPAKDRSKGVAEKAGENLQENWSAKCGV